MRRDVESVAMNDTTMQAGESKMEFRLRTGRLNPSPIAVVAGTNRLQALFESVNVGIAPPFKRRMEAMAPSTRNYVLLITPRSGSTFFAHEIAAQKRLGDPREWFNCDAIAKFVRDNEVGDISSYVDFIRRCQKSDNGVFGVKIGWHQLRFVTDLSDLRDLLGSNICWFYLRRRNLVAQAISLQIAVDSGIFHSYELERKAPKLVDYAAEKIRDQIEMILYSEIGMEAYIRERGIDPVRFFYEDDIMAPEKSVRAIMRALGEPEDLYRENPGKMHLSKMSSSINAHWEARFRAEYSIYLKGVAAARPMPFSSDLASNVRTA